MIKTLRITSIIAAIAATVLLVLPAVYGVRSDPKIEEFLKSPGAVDKFTAAKGQNPAKKDAETSPLVKQAADLGRILNPPPPPPPPPKAQPSAATQAAAAPAPPVVAAKFNLVATSYYASHPEQSFVLIDEPGKGLHWVKQGSAVGHLTIETVKDGTIIVRDGQRTSEMTVKVQESWRKLLKNPPSSTSPSSSSAEPASPTAQAPTGRPGPEPSPVTANKPDAASLPTRRSPRQGATPSAAERITSAVQPAPGQIARPSPAVEQPRPIEGGQAPPTSEANQPPPPSVAPPLVGQGRPGSDAKIPPPAMASQQVAAQPAPAGMQQPPAAEIAPPPEEKPAPEDSPAIKERTAKIDKLISEMKSSSDEKKTDELFKQVAELGKMRKAERANDVNAKDVNN
jgi:hypothetical protein